MKEFDFEKLDFQVIPFTNQGIIVSKTGFLQRIVKYKNSNAILSFQKGFNVLRQVVQNLGKDLKIKILDDSKYIFFSYNVSDRSLLDNIDTIQQFIQKTNSICLLLSSFFSITPLSNEESITYLKFIYPYSHILKEDY